MIFHDKKISSELTPSVTGSKSWFDIGLLNVNSVAHFRRLLVEKGWQAGQRDVKGHTLSGALIWKVLILRKQVRSADPMTAWLRQLRHVLQEEAHTLSLVERWWTKTLKQTSFVRYAAWHVPFHAAVRQTQGMGLESLSDSDAVTLKAVLDQTPGFLALEEWAFQEPLVKLWKSLECFSMRPFPEEPEGVQAVLGLLVNPAISPLALANPSQVWDWNWWTKGQEDRWAALLSQEQTWVALGNTGVGCVTGPAERQVHDKKFLQELGKVMALEGVELQELEKLLPSSGFLPRLKASWERWHWERTWENTPQVPRGPRL